MDPFWEAVRLKVCRMCVDGDGAGRCSLPRSEECMLKQMYPEVLGVLSSDTVRTWRYSATEVQARICGRCPHRRDQTGCNEQRRGECTLDRFLPDLVEIGRSIGDLRRHQMEGAPG